jgi:hypothetical protein
VTPEELATIRAGAETALDAIHRGWPWPEIDNDLVIGAALKDVSVLVAEVKRLRAALADIGKAAEENGDGLSGALVFERVCAALGLPGSHSFWLTPEQQDAVIRRLHQSDHAAPRRLP